MQHTSFVQTVIWYLLQTSGIIWCQSNIPWVVESLVVMMVGSGKERLVLDLQHVHELQHYWSSSLKVFLRHYNTSYKIDCFIKIRPPKQLPPYYYASKSSKYVDCVCYFPAGIKNLIFKCHLAFGLSTAGHIFSNVLRRLVT